MPSRPGALILSALLALSAVPSGAAEFLGAWTWEGRIEGFGGYSGLELDADGRTARVLSDSGWILSVTLRRNQDGLVDGVSRPEGTWLPDKRGRGIRGDFADSEGLAVLPDGDVAVSFENWPRVIRYDPSLGFREELPFYPGFTALETNRGLEALASNADGALFALPEKLPGGLPTPIFRFADGTWSIFDVIERRDGYSPVGADFDDRGRLYVLERKFVGIGFRSRLRQLTLDAHGVARDRTLFTSRIRQHDNLEGLAIWRDGSGELRATMISDDNFLWIQRTEFVDYSLPE